MATLWPFCFVLTHIDKIKDGSVIFCTTDLHNIHYIRNKMHVKSYFKAAGSINMLASVSYPATWQQKGSDFTNVGPGCDSQGQETRLSLCGVCSPHTDVLSCFLSVPWFAPVSKHLLILLLLPITKTLTWNWSWLYMVGTPHSTELNESYV